MRLRLIGVLFDQFSDYKGPVIRVVSLASAKAQLSELIHQAEQGEEILITRHGQAVVRLIAVNRPKRPVAPRASFREKLPGWSQDSASLIRAARDEAR